MAVLVHGVAETEPHLRGRAAQLLERGELDVQRGAATGDDAPHMPALEELARKSASQVMLRRFGPAPVVVVGELGLAHSV